MTRPHTSPTPRTRAAAVAALLLASAGAAMGQPAPLLPRLTADPPDGARFWRYTDDAGDSVDDTRLLLRFTGYLHNTGDGPLDLQGDPRLPPGAPGAVRQYLSTVGPLDAARTSTVTTNPAAWVAAPDRPAWPVVGFDPAPTHAHDHLPGIIEYSLWNTAGTVRVTAPTRVGMCLTDTEPDPTDNGPDDGVYVKAVMGPALCAAGNPSAGWMRMGVSEGYRTAYDQNRDGQWVDVSDVAPGTYRIAERVDPDGLVTSRGGGGDSPALSDPVTIPGYRAVAVSGSGAYRQPATVVLSSERFAPSLPVSDPAPDGYAGPGAVRYRVESSPAHGRLTDGSAAVAPGALLPAGVSRLTYLPDATFSGVDAFTFSAVNVVAGVPTRYPVHPAPAPATVLVSGSGIQVTITGAPARLDPGASAQLSAAVTGGTGGVTWTVDGVPGGNPVVGTITPEGRYTAPSVAPPAGAVTLQAYANDDMGARSAALRVVIGADAPVPDGGVATLAAPVVVVSGRTVVVTVTPPTAGSLAVGVLRAGRRQGGCAVPAVAGFTVTCRVRLRRAYDPGTLLVRTRLTSGAEVTMREQVAGPAGVRRLSVARRHGRAAVTVVPSRTGPVRVLMLRGGRVVARCDGGSAGGVTFTCVRSVPRGRLVLRVIVRGSAGGPVERERGM